MHAFTIRGNGEPRVIGCRIYGNYRRAARQVLLQLHAQLFSFGRIASSINVPGYQLLDRLPNETDQEISLLIQHCRFASGGQTHAFGECGWKCAHGSFSRENRTSFEMSCRHLYLARSLRKQHDTHRVEKHEDVKKQGVVLHVVQVVLQLVG